MPTPTEDEMDGCWTTTVEDTMEASRGGGYDGGGYDGGGAAYDTPDAPRVGLCAWAGNVDLASDLASGALGQGVGRGGRHG